MNQSVEEAKTYLRENYESGCHCPCCGQMVKLYKRALNSSMAAALIAVYRHEPKEYFHVGEYLATLPHLRKGTGGGDFAKLRHWGLIEEKEGLRDDGCKHNGFFKMTQRGRDFVEGTIKVESHIFIYDNKLKGFSDKYIDIREALGKHFNYRELMRGI